MHCRLGLLPPLYQTKLTKFFDPGNFLSAYNFVGFEVPTKQKLEVRRLNCEFKLNINQFTLSFNDCLIVNTKLQSQISRSYCEDTNTIELT